MRVRTGTTVWTAALAATVALTAAAATPALDALVAAERAFSTLSVQKGIRASFLTYLAPASVVFRPTATDGRKAMASRPARNPATLIWEPAFAEVSAAGDLGYDSGPWEMRPPPGSGQATLYGHFISVWRKQPGGAWRVVADIGTSHEKPASGGLGSGAFAAGPAHRVPALGPAALRPLDAAYSSAARTQGFAAAFAAQAAEDVRFNTDGSLPFVGIEAARAHVARQTGRYTFATQGSGIAASRDLGYTYGLAPRFEAGATTAADTSVYLHVWRRGAGGAWKLALAVMNPLPKP